MKNARMAEPQDPTDEQNDSEAQMAELVDALVSAVGLVKLTAKNKVTS